MIMDIIYLSSSCSEQTFNELREKGYTKKLPQAQKYHNLLMEGLAAVLDGKLTAIAAYPVNSQWTKKFRFPRAEEQVGSIRYVYSAFWNRNVLRQMCRKHGAKAEIKKLYRDNPDCVIICDVLNVSLAEAARACGKKYGIPVVGIVTDVPGHSAGARLKMQPFINRQIAKVSGRIVAKSLKEYDGYLLLTEAMNPIVNPKGKPYIVIEGHCDSMMAQRSNDLEGKTSPKVMMYAGGIHKEFGIQRLVDAFVAADIPGWECHIYGDGNYQNELTQLCKTQMNVKYFGSQPNALVVENQLKASLLVNPRLTDAEYVKYSFPSKTLECMVSGTPLLTTNLPGMPTSYHEYVYLFGEETTDAFRDVLEQVLSLDAKTLYHKGQEARSFALEEKNNVSQAKKLLEFVKTLKR